MVFEWKDIPGYEGYYQVSTLGMVRSIDREVNVYGSSSRHIDGQYIKQQDGKNGVKFVKLSKNGISTTQRVSHLVADTFIPNLENKRYIYHLNGDMSRNDIKNLVWLSDEEAKLCGQCHG